MLTQDFNISSKNILCLNKNEMVQITTNISTVDYACFHTFELNTENYDQVLRIGIQTSRCLCCISIELQTLSSSELQTVNTVFDLSGLIGAGGATDIYSRPFELFYTLTVSTKL